MKNKFIRMVVIAVMTLGLLLLSIFFIQIVFYRFPSEAEFIEHFQPDSSTPVIIDNTQGDIGFFGIKIGEEEQFFVEICEQWIFPGSTYKWDH
jgi:hypothetical protein